MKQNYTLTSKEIAEVAEKFILMEKEIEALR